jgi:hypothetical protein
MQIKSTSITMIKEEETTEVEENRLSPYMIFKFSIRSESTRKYYERRLRGFFDYIQFETEVNDMEKRCNNFTKHSKANINWLLNQILRFLQFQKQRSEKKEISAATLKNFVKSLKVFCDSTDLNIPWKK